MARCRFGNLAAFQWKCAAAPARASLGVALFSSRICRFLCTSHGCPRGKSNRPRGCRKILGRIPCFWFGSHGHLFGLLVCLSKVRIRSVASPMGRRYISFSDGVVQSRLTLRVSVCHGHRHIDARRVRRCNRVTPDQGGLYEWLDSAL